jgi:hypothetical protein
MENHLLVESMMEKALPITMNFRGPSNCLTVHGVQQYRFHFIKTGKSSFGQDLNVAIWNSYLATKVGKSEALE